MDYGEEYKEKLANLRGWNLLKEANKMRKRLLAFSEFGDVDEAYRCIKENRELNKTLALPELRFEVGSKAIEKAYLSALKAFDYSAMISEIESHMLKNK